MGTFSHRYECCTKLIITANIGIIIAIDTIAKCGIKFTNNDWAPDPKDAGQNLRAAIGVWQWQKTGNNQVFPKNIATSEPLMVPLPDWSKR